MFNPTDISEINHYPLFNIQTVQRMNDYMAWYNNDTTIYETGRTEVEAIGRLIRRVQREDNNKSIVDRIHEWQEGGNIIYPESSDKFEDNLYPSNEDTDYYSNSGFNFSSN